MAVTQSQSFGAGFGQGVVGSIADNAIGSWFGRRNSRHQAGLNLQNQKNWHGYLKGEGLTPQEIAGASGYPGGQGGEFGKTKGQNTNENRLAERALELQDKKIDTEAETQRFGIRSQFGGGSPADVTAQSQKILNEARTALANAQKDAIGKDRVMREILARHGIQQVTGQGLRELTELMGQGDWLAAAAMIAAAIPAGRLLGKLGKRKRNIKPRGMSPKITPTVRSKK